MSRQDYIARSEQIKNETEDNANTAQRVGSLFEDLSSDARLKSEKIGGRAFYNGVDVPFTLVTDTAKRIETEAGLYDIYNISDGVTLENDRLVVGKSGRILINGMVSFEGYNGGQFKLQLRKNDEVVCDCNPLVQTFATRTTNLVSTDFTEAEEGDTISLWIVDEGSGGTIQLKSSKIVITNI